MTNGDAEKYRELAEKAQRIAAKNPGSNWENIYHSLVLLEEEPIERLRRALQRGQYVKNLEQKNPRG